VLRYVFISGKAMCPSTISLSQVQPFLARICICSLWVLQVVQELGTVQEQEVEGCSNFTDY
jgi:hypothetical protein